MAPLPISLSRCLPGQAGEVAVTCQALDVGYLAGIVPAHTEAPRLSEAPATGVRLPGRSLLSKTASPASSSPQTALFNSLRYLDRDECGRNGLWTV
jgi:hypothetical protein